MGDTGQGLCAAVDRHPRCRGGSGLAMQTSLISLALMCSILVGACADIRVRVGSKPDTDVLERSLRVGESTRADVLAALGEPTGKGRAMLPINSKPRTMWSYYYEEGDLKDARRIFLFVYFDEDRYDGYMWFSSLPK